MHSSLGDAGDAGVGGDGGGGEGGGGDGEDGAGAAAGGAEDSSSEEDDDDIQVVLHQPEDEEDEGEEEEYAGEGGEEEEAAADGMADASPGGGGETPSGGKVPAEGATPGKSPAFTPNKKNTWVNPKLQGAEGGSGTPSSVAPKPSAKQLKALKARLGPLAHVPGGLEIDLSGEMPENIDIDSLQDKPWHKPDADPTDYFNYGFVEDTWRLYCRKQQEVRRRGAERGGGHTAPQEQSTPPPPTPNPHPLLTRTLPPRQVRLEKAGLSKINTFDGGEQSNQSDLPAELRMLQGRPGGATQAQTSQQMLAQQMQQQMQMRAQQQMMMQQQMQQQMQGGGGGMQPQGMQQMGGMSGMGGMGGMGGMQQQMMQQRMQQQMMMQQQMQQQQQQQGGGCRKGAAACSRVVVACSSRCREAAIWLSASSSGCSSRCSRGARKVRPRSRQTALAMRGAMRGTRGAMTRPRATSAAGTSAFVDGGTRRPPCPWGLVGPQPAGKDAIKTCIRTRRRLLEILILSCGDNIVYPYFV